MAPQKTLPLSAILPIVLVVLTLGTGTSEAVGVGVSNLVNPLFQPLSSSLRNLAPKPEPLLTVVANSTKALLDGDGTAGLIGVGPACWGGLNILNLVNVDLTCLNYGCSDIIQVIWELLMIFGYSDTSVGSLTLLHQHLETVIIPSPTETTRICTLLNRMHIHSKCQTDYHRSSALEKVIGVDVDKIYSGSYTLKYVSDYVVTRRVCLESCLRAHGYTALPPVTTVRDTTTLGGLLGGLLDPYQDCYINVCPNCICNIIQITLPATG